MRLLCFQLFLNLCASSTRLSSAFAFGSASLRLGTGFRTKLEKTSLSAQCLPNESEYFAANAQFSCLLVSDNTMVGRDDSYT